MINEKWNWSYLNMEIDSKKHTLKILHYSSFGEPGRYWYRIYDYDPAPGFKARGSAVGNVIGYGRTFEEAVLDLIARRNGGC